MDLSGRRRSTNVDDRRGKSGGTIAGIGIGGAVIALIITLLFGGDPAEVVQQLGGQQTQTEYGASEQEEQLRVFAEQILASTEDVWTDQFQRMGKLK